MIGRTCIEMGSPWVGGWWGEDSDQSSLSFCSNPAHTSAHTTPPATNCTYIPSPRIKVKKGLHVMAARLAQPTLWTAKLDRFKGSKHHTTLITCHRVGPVEPNSRWVLSSHEG